MTTTFTPAPPKRGWLGWALRIGLLLVVVFAGSIAALYLAGSNMPANHVVTCQVDYAKPPAEVWTVIADAERWPQWWSILDSITIKPRTDDKPVWHLHYRDGNNFDLVLTHQQPPTSLKMTIEDHSKLFSGTWEYTLISTTTGGTRLTLTETGHVSNPAIRCLASLVADHDLYVRMHLTALGQRLGESAPIQRVK